MIKQVTGTIRIISIPTGEAPLSVRQAWLGLELPVVAESNQEAFSLQTGRSVGNQHVYHVQQADAIEALRSQFPSIALWWEKHGFPQDGKNFGFLVKEVEVIGKLKEKTLSHFVGLEEVGVGAHDHPANIRN